MTIKTADMSLRQFLSTMNWEPRQALALQSLFDLPDKLELGCCSNIACKECVWIRATVVELRTILGEK